MTMERGMRAARAAGVNFLALTIWAIAFLVGCRYLWSLATFLLVHWVVTAIALGVVALVAWIFVLIERIEPWP